MSVFSTIQSLAEIDFDTLFSASLPAMDAGSYVWPEDGMTAGAKHDFVRAHCERILTLDGGFGFKEVLDGVNVSGGVGLLRDGLFSPCIGLVQPDANGSRAFTYDTGRLGQWRAFLRSHGAHAMALLLPDSSPIYTQLPDRYDMAQAVVSDGSRPGQAGAFVSVRLPL